MDINATSAKFDGFGPITSSQTTFAQGIGRGGSFTPIWTDGISLRPRQIYQPAQEQVTTHPFNLSVVNTVDDNVAVSKIRIQYGEIDGIAPDGLTLDEDYFLEPGNSFIYLIVTFDGDGRIDSRTIGFDDPVPDDTDSEKYIIIGQVEYAAGVYKIINQNITQDIYPEKALVVDRSNDEFVYSLFADPRKINAIYELENFNVNLDGDNLTTRLYLKSQDNAEYLELKKDSGAGECSVYGYANNEAQNFAISANDTDSVSKLVLYDTGSANYLESKVDTGAKKTSVYGYADNEICNFELIADNTAQKSNVSVFGQNSNVYASMATEVEKASVYGYSGNEAQNFVLSSDNTEDKSSLALFDTGSQNYIEIKEENDVASVYGYMNNQDHNFLLKAQAGQSFLQLFNQANDAYVELKQANSETSLYGYIGSGDEYFILQAKAGDTKLYLEAGDDNATMKTTGIAFTDTGNTRNSALSETGLLIAKPNGQTTITESSITIEEPNSGPNVYINIPTAGGSTVSASWKEIDVCVDGVAKKMQVLGTDPYDPPAP